MKQLSEPLLYPAHTKTILKKINLFTKGKKNAAPQPIQQPYKTFWNIPVPSFLKHLFQQDKLSSETGQTVGVGEGAVVILGGARRTASMIVRGGKPSVSLVAICHYNAAHVRLIRKEEKPVPSPFGIVISVAIMYDASFWFRSMHTCNNNVLLNK
ncbi:hypothetical protein CEXT_412051 [Caerostris extrusa]|uniref:Uncharacterized protein n=1 Tax=Caerostris extrusa TaxID=172846 RepID=A0AAV4UIZ8_CAEEX|nr:hypothetical protein CEXT_412051 [Caerostris extrusa]